VRRSIVIHLAAAFLFPLVPALLLFGVFSSENSAIYDKAGLKLGGPAALYFALLLLAFRYVNKWRIVSDPLEKLKKDLVGSWDIESSSAQSDKVLVSMATFDLKDGGLSLGGGTFKMQGKPFGRWTPTRVIPDPHHDGVVYLYELTDVKNRNAWRGIMELTFVHTKTPLTMEGTWEVIGPEYHSGTVTFAKHPSSS
jgi:hypothetical protein